VRDIDALIISIINAGRLRVDTEHGLVYALKSNTPDKPIGTLTAKGYLRACINFEGRQVHAMIHRIVWVSENGPVPEGHQIDHGQGGKPFNGIENLEAVTGAENMRRAARDGLTNGGWRDGPRDPSTGQFVGKRVAGRLLDGVEHNGMPT
jgi:HNH endonuclease